MTSIPWTGGATWSVALPGGGTSVITTLTAILTLAPFALVAQPILVLSWTHNTVGSGLSSTVTAYFVPDDPVQPRIRLQPIGGGGASNTTIAGMAWGHPQSPLFAQGGRIDLEITSTDGFTCDGVIAGAVFDYAIGTGARAQWGGPGGGLNAAVTYTFATGFAGEVADPYGHLALSLVGLTTVFGDAYPDTPTLTWAGEATNQPVWTDVVVQKGPRGQAAIGMYEAAAPGQGLTFKVAGFPGVALGGAETSAILVPDFSYAFGTILG